MGSVWEIFSPLLRPAEAELEKADTLATAPNGILPPPFPVFGSWTRFPEDEIME